jgi:hypothetical protein
LGLAGLDDRRGREQSSLLTSEQETELRGRFEADPTLEDQVCSLPGKGVQRIAEF